MRIIVFLAAVLVAPLMASAQNVALRFDGSIPVYPKSTLATMGGPAENDPKMAALLKAGTSATFVSSDDVSTVIAWYRKHLPGSYVMKSSAGAAQFTSGGNQVNVYAHRTTAYRTRIVILPQ